MGGWWAGKVRQFWRHVGGRVSPAERSALLGWLTPPQLALFEQMHPADQRHGLDVVASLRAAGHADDELLVAGLLHDAAKGPAVGLWHRVAWSLAERYGPGVERLACRLPGFETAFERMAQHADRSAAMAGAAGCTQRTVELIRNQSAPLDPLHGEALRLADDAN